jgi:hypothetical protein
MSCCGEVVYFRLLSGDLEAACSGCGEHLFVVEVDHEA